MEINIIGGGPAGLYFALLMKRHDASHRVTVFERNPPDATFGWGVVFSGRTLSNLREADAVSHQRIAESFETWDNVDVVLRDRRVSIRGNHFSGIARLRLLNILQERCAELGVGLRFRTEVEDARALAADCDLLVGADGVHDLIADRHHRTRGDSYYPVRNRAKMTYCLCERPRAPHPHDNDVGHQFVRNR